VTTRLHHAAVCARDVEASVRFYRDGVGLEVLMDRRFEGDWPTLFGAPTTVLRSVFLGDRRHPDAGVVELVDFGRPLPAAGASTGPHQGFFLLSFVVDVDEVLGRLSRLGHTGVRRVEQPGPAGPVAMVSVVDPDGVLVELIDAGPGPDALSSPADPHPPRRHEG